MKKILVCLLLLAAVAGFAAAQDLTGLSVGAEAWNTPGKDDYDDNSFSIAPFAEFEKGIDIIDLYLKGQYIFNLDDEVNQGIYLEEQVAFNFGQAGPGSLAFTVNNYNMLGTVTDDTIRGLYYYSPDDYVYTDRDGDTKITGRIEPGATYTLSGLSFAEKLDLTAALPVGYAPSDEGEYIDLTAEAAFGLAGGIGLSGKMYINLDKEWDDEALDDFYEFDFTASYTKKDVFTAYLEIDFFKNDEGDFMKSYAFIPGIEAYVDTFTIYAEVEIDYFTSKGYNVWNEDEKTSLGFLVGAKKAF